MHPDSRGVSNPAGWPGAATLVLPALLSIVLLSPLLSSPFLEDDYVAIATMEGRGPWMSRPLDLWRFSSGEPSEVENVVQRGGFPWWTSPQWRFAPWRPIASLLLAGDHWLFGRGVLGYRLHSSLWLALAVIAVGWLYRGVMSARTALAATALFVLSDVTIVTAGWISSRHFVVTCAFGCAALGLHVLGRRGEGGSAARLGATALLAVSLLVGEPTLQLLGYFAAFELFQSGESWSRRLRALAPSAAVVAAYLVIYRASARGIGWDGNYTDPLQTPGRYLFKLASVGPEYASALLLGPLFRGMKIPGWWLIPPAFAGVLWLCARWLTDQERRAARWLGLGSLLALLPAASGGRGERLLLVPSIGGWALAAFVLAAAWRALREGLAAPRRGQRGAVAVAAAGLLILHAAVAPAMWWRAIRHLDRLARVETDQVVEVEIARGVKDVFVIAPNLMAGPWAPAVRDTVRSDRSPSWWILAMGWGDFDVRRTGARTFELGGGLTDSCPFVRRFDRFPMKVGDRLRQAPLTFEVLSVSDGRPTRVAVALDRSLDDPSLTFLARQETRIAPFQMPAIGASLVLHTSAPARPPLAPADVRPAAGQPANAALPPRSYPSSAP